MSSICVWISPPEVFVDIVDDTVDNCGNADGLDGETEVPEWVGCTVDTGITVALDVTFDGDTILLRANKAR